MDPLIAGISFFFAGVCFARVVSRDSTMVGDMVGGALFVIGAAVILSLAGCAEPSNPLIGRRMVGTYDFGAGRNNADVYLDQNPRTGELSLLVVPTDEDSQIADVCPIVLGEIVSMGESGTTYRPTLDGCVTQRIAEPSSCSVSGRVTIGEASVIGAYEVECPNTLDGYPRGWNVRVQASAP